MNQDPRKMMKKPKAELVNEIYKLVVRLEKLEGINADLKESNSQLKAELKVSKEFHDRLVITNEKQYLELKSYKELDAQAHIYVRSQDKLVTAFTKALEKS
jgi:hypothetical protein